jgi:putative FmdB family regulatory protein
MPIYEYECRSCKERFEVMQKISEGNEALHCPSCDTDKPTKLLSAFCSIGSTGASSTSSGHSSPGHS